MKIILNPHITLLALGVLQPASAQEVRAFLATIFRDAGILPSFREFEEFLVEQEAAKRVLKISQEGTSLFSLTLLGTHYLSPDLRKRRDKLRAYLLRDAHSGRYLASREYGKDLAGVAPASDTSSDVKGRAANKLGRRKSGQAYWPRIRGQFDSRTGSTRRSRDTFPFLISFENTSQGEIAAEREFSFDYVGIGLCLGLSPQLIWNMSRWPSNYYRSFEVNKRGGGKRLIESPRVFLKVVQWFLSDFVLSDLPVHESVHSFISGRSIVTNARPHVGRRYVGNADIENFFGSVAEEAVISLLLRNNFKKVEAESIAKLCTNRGVLPQGAPTSPILSNAMLFDVDKAMFEFCTERGLIYSRYADDITVSGGLREDVEEAFKKFEELIASIGLKINSGKTRIAHSNGRQKVTGVVVNFQASPGRLFRRQARAAFHNAALDPQTGIKRLPELSGILGFLKIFPSLNEQRDIQAYTQIIAKLRNLRRLVSAPIG